MVHTCRVDRSVARPWRITSIVERMEGILEVKGAAMEASPSFTISTSPIPWSSSASHGFCGAFLQTSQQGAFV